MADALFLVPLAVILSVAALAAFIWNLSNGQYEDLAGAAERVIHDDRDRPLRDARQTVTSPGPMPRPVPSAVQRSSVGDCGP